jgi:hypothetical protein
MLWRLESEGVKMDSRWDTVYKAASGYKSVSSYGWNDLHILLGCPDHVASQHLDELTQKFSQLSVKIEAGQGSMQEKLFLNHVYPVGRSILSFSLSDYETSAASLYPVLSSVQQLGGSHAQRDVFNQLFLKSCVRSGQKTWTSKAQELLERRLEKHAENLRERDMYRQLLLLAQK